ncbi:RrF2 family transcriptional regulator [Methylibium sp.]|uniref:RrF2 family transcriptional regulator n=1 Tax=Methylibium sp. TaxID=2067992 RepID=UPI003D13B475
MKLTRFTDYSLRVLIYLASEPDRRATIAEIATAFQVKENHLTKVVHFLGQSGLVATVRGKGGGLGLARAPAQVVVGEVVRQTEGAAMPAECFDKATNTCSIARVCRLHGVLKEATDAFYAVLDKYTLEDLVHNREALSRVLFIGRPGPAPRAAARA